MCSTRSASKPLVAPDGGVYYEIRRDDLAGQPQCSITVPASEIIHDTMVPVSSARRRLADVRVRLVAMQGLKIQENATNFFANGVEPGRHADWRPARSSERARRSSGCWDEYTGANVGNALIRRRRPEVRSVQRQRGRCAADRTVEVDGRAGVRLLPRPGGADRISPRRPTRTIEPLVQQYYAQCLQCADRRARDVADDGLGLGPTFGNTLRHRVDIDDLHLDGHGDADRSGDRCGIARGVLSPNEARPEGTSASARSRAATRPTCSSRCSAWRRSPKRDADEPFSKPAPCRAAGGHLTDDDEVERARAGAAVRRTWRPSHDRGPGVSRRSPSAAIDTRGRP